MKPYAALVITLVFVCLIVLQAGCASQQTLTNIGSEYQKANQAAVAAVSDAATRGKTTRRVASVVAYINTTQPSALQNLDPNASVDSFANFVCTGADDFAFSRAGLSYTAAYAGAISAITTAPDDSVSGYWQALSALKGEDKPLALPDVRTGEFQKCRDDVRKVLPPIGVSAGAVSTESATSDTVIAAIQAIDALIKDGLKVVVEAEQKQKLKKFIASEQQQYKQVIDTDLSTKEMQTQFSRRKQTAIAIPYYEFLDMLALSRTTQRVQLLKAAKQIDEDLSDYDSLRLMKSPETLAATFQAINEKLTGFAAGKISLTEAKAFFDEMEKELTQAKKDYQSAVTAINTLK